MKVILRYAQVVSLVRGQILPLNHREEEIVDAPDFVEVGWYLAEGYGWIPPESQRKERSKSW